MFRRHRGAHRDRAKHVTRAADGQQDQKTEEADAEQRVEDRLHADAIDDVNEQAEAEQEGDRLKPDEGAARIAGTGRLGFIDEFFQLANSRLATVQVTDFRKSSRSCSRSR